MISRNALLAETAKRRRAMKISRPHWKNYLSVLLLAVASLLLATATTTAFQVHQKDSSALLPLSKKNNGNIWHHEQRVVSPRYLFQRIEDETIEEVQKERLSSRIGNRMGSLKNRTMLKFSSRRSTAKKTADDVAVWVKDVHELRREVLQNKIPLKVRTSCACTWRCLLVKLSALKEIHCTIACTPSNTISFGIILSYIFAFCLLYYYIVIFPTASPQVS